MSSGCYWNLSGNNKQMIDFKIFFETIRKGFIFDFFPINCLRAKKQMKTLHFGLNIFRKTENFLTWWVQGPSSWNKKSFIMETLLKLAWKLMSFLCETIWLPYIVMILKYCVYSLLENIWTPNYFRHNVLKL